MSLEEDKGYAWSSVWVCGFSLGYERFLLSDDTLN